ncbi:MAG: AraC family ligand binding domain-containing protein [Candidatus Latescibacteria bacterium]|nr:AraC family ligand binding domain-containing protein [Candidatus Latescibacterota bacterium]
MPVHHGLSPTNRPDWCDVTSAGIFRVLRDGRFDRHYHDFNEYWLIYKGRARVMSEGKEYVVGPGDIVCTRTGDEHDFIEVYEDVEAFWFEDPCPPGGRLGHLHKRPELAEGHVVPGA